MTRGPGARCAVVFIRQYSGSSAAAILGHELADGDVHQRIGLDGFAEQALVHGNPLARVNTGIPFSRDGFLGCGTATAT